MQKKFLLILSFLVVAARLCTVAQTTEAPSSRLADKIIAIQDKIIQEGKTTNQLSEKDLASLPVGIPKDIGGITYWVIIDSARFTPQGAFFNAYVILDFKTSGKNIAFMGRNIAFQPGGLAAATSSKLLLASEESIPLNNKVALILKADGRNFVEMDCNGFKSVNIKGFFEFERDFLLPENPDGTIAAGKMTASLEVNTTDWGSMMANINLPAFQIPKVKGLSFSVRDAVIDLSDTANPPNFQFPKDYINTNGNNINLWQGFFLREARVRLYKELESSRGKKEVLIQNMLIDNMGVSGSLGVTNVFGQDEGSLNGWPFSVDSLGITVVKSQLKGAAARGLMNIPFFDKDQPTKYSAMIFDNNGETDFLFSLSPSRNLKANVLAAEVELLQNSTIIVARTAGKLKPEAILNGTITIKSGELLNLNRIEFNTLHLTSDAPYIKSGVFSMTGNGQQKAANYPLVINKLGFAFNQSQMNLTVDGAINLMNSSGNGFGAQAMVNISGEVKQIEETQGDLIVKRQEWRYKDTKFSNITINVKTGAFSLDGSLTIYDKDPIYGNGFRGEINATFTPGPKVKAIAQFGVVKDNRYWYVDAMVVLPAPVGTGFGLYGIGGGLYYGMALQRPNVNSVGNFVTKTGSSDRLDVGASRSDARYIPDPTVGLGFKATVALGLIPSPQPFNGDATFEMSFNSSGGLRMIRFQGQGYFMSELSFPRNKNAPIYANLEILFDFKNSSLHANLDTYVNIGGVLQGVNAGGLAGSAVLHFAPDEWYIHIGTPEQRIGLNFIGLVKTGAYFMVGTYIPGMPAPPQAVSDILGGMDLNFMRNENALANGGGFAFGAGLEIKTPRIEVLIFYGQFSAGLGFDIMLKNYGSARCAGGSGPIGINGWYASGQAWAYFQGSIGVFVDLTFIKGEFEILRIGAAAVLQAKLPNPLWMRGVVGGQFSILGGLVSGNCRFSITIGEECQIEGVSSVTGVKVISSLKPQPADGEVDVFTGPQAAFNVSIDKEFEMMDLNNNFKAYRVKLDHFKIISDGKELAGTLQWNDNKDVVIINPAEILPPKSKVKADVKVHWEQKVNGTWQPLSANGKTEGEQMASEFNTGTAPDYIPESNVLYSYPMTAQHNFMKREYPDGYMKLKVGQSYLFNKSDSGKEWDFVARFTAAGQPVGLSSPLSYQNGNISYQLPGIANDKVFNVHFVKVPKGAAQAVDKNVVSAEKQLASNEAGNISTTTKEIQGTVTLAEEKKLYESFFRSSKFNTFGEKLDAMTGYQTVGRIMPGFNVYEPGAWANLTEVFDKAEVAGIGAYEPLLQLEALPDNVWFSSRIYPTIYELYPAEKSLTISWRPIDKAGLPPLKSMSINQDDFPELSEQDLTSAVNGKPGRSIFVYSLSYYAYRDFYELRQKAFDLYTSRIGAAPLGAFRLMSIPYYDVDKGPLRFNLSYKLPGINRITTTKTFVINW
jgi:hypothetical protein